MATKHAFPSFTLFVASHPDRPTPLAAAGAQSLAQQIEQAQTAASAPDPPAIFQIVYWSEAAAPMDEDAVGELLRSARAKNERLGITGVLLYKAGTFLQLLEGDEDTVRTLYATIEADPRHRAVETLFTARGQDRLFPDWTMGVEHLDDADVADDDPAVTSFLDSGQLPTDREPLPMIARALERFKTLTDAPPQAAESGPMAPSQGYRLLVVEDNRVTQRLLRVMFEEDAHVVDTAQTVDEALFKAEANPYDAFLLDINLGERRTGIEVLHAIRRMPQHEGVPAIACTAYALHDQQAVFREAGFSAIVTKPITKRALLQSIEDAIADPASAAPFADDAYEDLPLPPLPTSIPQLLTLIAHGDAQGADFERLIRILARDQVLATWLIRTANSAFFKLSASVESVEAAIQYLGFRPACNLLLGKLLTERFHGFDTEREEQVYTYVMQLGLGAAYLARALGQRIDHPHPEIAYSGVLLSQLGRLLLLDEHRARYAALWFEGDAFAGPPPLGQETLAVSTNYVTLGAHIGRRNDFSDRIVRLIRYHQRPSDLSDADQKLLAFLVAAGLDTYTARLKDPDRDLLPLLLASHPLAGLVDLTGAERRALMRATQDVLAEAHAFVDDVFPGGPH